jgi:hypothetical protein
MARITEELWQAFLACLGSDEEKDQAKLNDKLVEVAHILEDTRGPFVGADYVSATDVKLTPRLRHILVALPGLKVASCGDCFEVWATSAKPLLLHLNFVIQKSAVKQLRYVVEDKAIH